MGGGPGSTRSAGAVTSAISTSTSDMADMAVSGCFLMDTGVGTTCLKTGLKNRRWRLRPKKVVDCAGESHKGAKVGGPVTGMCSCDGVP